MTKLSQLKGLGLKSEKSLNEIGIFNKQDLQNIGAVKAFITLRNEARVKPSLNFLYAIVGALEDRHWAEIAKSERERLIFELEGYNELEKILKMEDIDIKLKRKGEAT